MSLRTYRHFAAVGPSDRRDALIARTRRTVQARSGYRCEMPGCPARGVDLAHGFMRGNLIGKPLCDLPMLTYWSCRAHNLDDPGDELRWHMVHDCIATLDLDAADCLHFGDTPLDAMRRVERTIKAAGRWHDLWAFAS